MKEKLDRLKKSLPHGSRRRVAKSFDVSPAFVQMVLSKPLMHNTLHLEILDALITEAESHMKKISEASAIFNRINSF